MPSIALKHEVIAAAILTARLLYCICTLLMCTNTACSTGTEQRLCSEALTSEVGLLQNIRAYKWIPLSMEKKSFPSKDSDTKILQSMYFAYEVGIKSALIPIESIYSRGGQTAAL